MTDFYAVKPFQKPCRGAVSVPGSKSITNRALLCAAQCPGEVVVENALFSRDTEIMVHALKALGVVVEQEPSSNRVRIRGSSGDIPAKEETLHFGNAGTAGRFLTAFCASREGGIYHCDGDQEMRERPYAGLLRALESMGARFEFHEREDFLPFTIYGARLRGGEVPVAAHASSQFLSALMMVAPGAEGPVVFRAPGVRPAFVRLTAELMGQFGISVSWDPGTETVSVEPGSFSLRENGYRVEPDATAASYFLMLPRLVGGTLEIRGLRRHMLQGDTAFCGVLEDLGARFEENERGLSVSYAPLAAWSGDPRCYDFTRFSDTFLTLAAAAPALQRPLRIQGIAHTRHQETDRVAGMAAELNKFAVDVIEEPDALTVYPRPEKQTPQMVTIETYRDHRFAMSFAILGSYDLHADARPWVSLRDPGCAGKTFPGFYDTLENLYQICHDNE